MVNLDLFEHIAKRADEMYLASLERLQDHKRAGRFNEAVLEAHKTRHYLAFRRRAHHWLDRAREKKAVAA